MLRKEIKGKRYVMVPEEAWEEIVDIFKIKETHVCVSFIYWSKG